MKKIIEKITLLITFLSLLSSCAIHKSISKATVNIKEELYQNIQIKYDSTTLSIQYGHEYWFHKFTKKLTLYWNEGFVKSINKNKKGKILFAGHSMCAPYVSTIALLYNDTDMVKFAQQNAQYMRTQFKASNILIKKDTIGANNFIELSYELEDKPRKVDANYLEYYSVQGGHILRVVFWTMEGDQEFFKYYNNESMKTLKSNTL